MTEDADVADPHTDPDSNGDTGDDTGMGPDGGSTTGTPRWVKVFGIVALVVVVLFVVLLLTGRGGEHGPGRHSSGDARGYRPPAGVTEQGMRQP